jgi:hypothetical protein
MSLFGRRAVHSITVLVAGFRGMFAEIVTRFLTGQRDLDVIQRTEPGEVLAAVRERDVSVVLLPMIDDELPLLGGQLLAAKPSLRVLGIAENGRAASLFELKPVRRSLGELSAEALADAVRAASQDT